MGKSMKGQTADEWKQKEIIFQYGGKTYRSKIESNLVLKDLSPTEIKNHLNELPAKYAYWKAFQVKVERELADLKDEYELWFVEKLIAIDNEVGKSKSEGLKKNMVLLENVKEYKAWRLKIKDLEDINKKIGVLTTGFNTMVWTLREIARLTYGEMSNIEAHGKRSLADL